MPMSTDKRRALIALALLVPIPSISVLMAMIVMPGPVGQSIYMAGKVVLLAFPLVWLLAVERGSISWSPVRKGGMGVGTLIGVVIAIAVVAAYVTIGPHLIDAEQVGRTAAKNGIDSIVMYVGLSAYLVTINSLIEEYVWRWFIFRQFERLMPGCWAMFASAAAFTAHHVIALRAQFDWTTVALASAGVFIGGAVWSWCYWRYRSVWPGYVSHVIVDIAVLAIGWHLIFARVVEST